MKESLKKKGKNIKGKKEGKYWIKNSIVSYVWRDMNTRERELYLETRRFIGPDCELDHSIDHCELDHESTWQIDLQIKTGVHTMNNLPSYHMHFFINPTKRRLRRNWSVHCYLFNKLEGPVSQEKIVLHLKEDVLTIQRTFESQPRVITERSFYQGVDY